MLKGKLLVPKNALTNAKTRRNVLGFPMNKMVVNLIVPFIGVVNIWTRKTALNAHHLIEVAMAQVGKSPSRLDGQIIIVPYFSYRLYPR